MQRKLLWFVFVITVSGNFSLAIAGTAKVMPKGMHAVSVLYSPFSYEYAYDNDRNRKPIAQDMIDMLNQTFGADVVNGHYKADYQFLTLEYLYGITPRLTLDLKLPFFKSKIQQSVVVYAPDPQKEIIQAQLDAMDIKTKSIEEDGLGDVDLWLAYQYLNTSYFRLSAGLGYRTQALAGRFGKDTERLNIGTQEQDDLMLLHNIDFTPFKWLCVNYKLEINIPFEGEKHIRDGLGQENLVKYKPGRQFTHEIELTATFWEDRIWATYGFWYRDEDRATTDNSKEVYDHDYTWDKIVIGYNGVTDYEKKNIPFPMLIDWTYWHLINARNTSAYYNSYWELRVTLPFSL